jgi:hypothetical protein
VERVDLGDADMSQDRAFVAPVDLRLQVKPHPLVVAGAAVLLDQPLVNDRALEQQLDPQPGVDHMRERAQHLGAGTRSRRRAWRSHVGVFRQVLTHRPTVQSRLPGDL